MGGWRERGVEAFFLHHSVIPDPVPSFKNGVWE